MTVYECPDCGAIVTTESTVAGPFELPPVLRCVHAGGGTRMVVIE